MGITSSGWPEGMALTLAVNFLLVAGFVAEQGSAAPANLEAVSDEHGEFAMPDTGVTGVLRPIGDELSTVLEPRVAEYDVEQHYVLVVAPRAPLAGVVVDDAGKPLAEAHVQLDPPKDLRARLQRVIDRSATVRLEAVSDSAGRFSIASAPLVPGATLTTRQFDCRQDEQAAPTEQRASLRIVLHRLESTAGRLEGLIVDPDGAPISGAYLFFARGSEETDERGRFQFRLFDGAPWEHLRVVKRGFELFEIAPRTENALDPSAFPRPLRIELARAQEPLRIEGTVFDEFGRPLAGASVQRLGGRTIGTLNRRSASGSYSDAVELETLLAGEKVNAGSATDERGRFVVGGLIDGEYALRVLDRRTMRAHEIEPIHAGSRDVRIEMPHEASYARVAGRVIDTNGVPIARAEVLLYRTFQDVDPVFGDKKQNYVEGERSRCDAEGRFELRDVATGIALLSASTPGANRITNVDLSKQPDVEHLEIVVPRAAHVQIDASASSLDATMASFHDADGNWVWATLHDGARSWTPLAPINLIDRRSAAVAVPLNATEVVLCNVVDNHVEELLHIPLHLEAGKLTIVKP